MAAQRSLKELLAQADAHINGVVDSGMPSQEKVAASSEVESLVNLLSEATESVVLGQEETSELSTPNAALEKAAMAMNRVNTALCLDAIVKVDRFEKKAASEGYDESQIDEALSKTAAKKMLDSLPLLVAMSGSKKSPDVNALPEKPTKAPRAGRLALTKNLGY